ncbi:hypothetical protein AVEN_58025-1 [Araneus ventricosus]|uniref:Uncharacterized protein n=1 Tax=Araneus ventricosus TaxID=182803 RepID=A0A4Y2FHP6_ARAVE|nr:hypothetical protein AVEN_58025-1 [Araneus ventricosus]
MSETRSRPPNRLLTRLSSAFSSTPPFCSDLKGWSFAFLSFHWSTEFVIRPTTNHVCPQWSISTVGSFLDILTTRAMQVSHASTPLIY